MRLAALFALVFTITAGVLSDVPLGVDWAALIAVFGGCYATLARRDAS